MPPIDPAALQKVQASLPPEQRDPFPHLRTSCPPYPAKAAGRNQRASAAGIAEGKAQQLVNADPYQFCEESPQSPSITKLTMERCLVLTLLDRPMRESDFTFKRVVENGG